MDRYGRCESDEERKDVTERLLVAWNKMPEMRLAQLFVCVHGVDPFHVEDKPFIEDIEAYVEEG